MNLQLFAEGDDAVLIETLWNVKFQDLSHYAARQIRINRNIVECKATFSDLTQDLESVLIETLWNVKMTPIIISNSSYSY